MLQNYCGRCERIVTGFGRPGARDNEPWPVLRHAPRFRWYRSLYFRIGFSFVAFVAGLLALRGFLFSVVLSRPPLRGSPNTVVALVAADLTAVLTEDRALDIDAPPPEAPVRDPSRYAVMRNGSIASNRSAPLADDLRRYIEIC